MFGQIQYIDSDKTYDSSAKIVTYCLKKVGLEKQKDKRVKYVTISNKFDARPLYLDNNDSSSYKIIYFMHKSENISSMIVNQKCSYMLMYPYATCYLDNFEKIKDMVDIEMYEISFNYTFIYSITNSLAPITIHNILMEDKTITVHEYTGQNIFIFKNVFEENFCNRIIDIADTMDKEGVMRYERKKNETVKNQNVECKYIQLSSLLNNEKFSSQAKELDDTIYSKLNTCMKTLHILKKFDTTSDSGYCLRKIFGETHAHADGLEPTDKGIRCLSVISQFNNNFTGGIYRFPYINISKRLDKGDIIALPPYWTHYHLTTPVAENEYRYTINTWFYQELKAR